ncbi:unnamed protein product [Adineta ricciae]|uniref:Uncharacterized protein n=1 Tax=Adineta ricciae TaxID=249248 RepID=A0A816CK74_ADIRI|nr:unnamed protein product [Adineta ricciae]CAF1624487.1 unnamed protein product [Adineta ricciae]
MVSCNSNVDVNRLNEQIQTLSRRVDQLERRAMKQIVKKLFIPPELQKIQLHEQKMQYHIDLLNYLPPNEDVKAVLLAVKVVHSNHPFGHAYLGFSAHQQRCLPDQKTDFIEQTYNCHGTIHQQELIVPWNSSVANLSMNLVIDVTYSYNTGSYPEQGNVNHFEIKVTGYII